MPHYWLSVAIITWHNTLQFLGKSKGGIFLDIIIVCLTLYRLYRRHGWIEMRTKIWETVFEGLAITLLAGTLVYAGEFLAAPPAMQNEAESNVGRAIAQREREEILLQSCSKNLAIESERSKLLGDQRDQQQITINSEQSQLGAQQGTVNQCVVSLGKMNPIVREKISVVPITFATMSANGRINDPKGLVLGYLSELFIITNEPQRTFNGDLKCTKDFFIVQEPRINPRETVGMIMRAASQPKMIAPNEFLITVDSSGTEWNASHPAFMTIKTTEANLGCTFTPQE